MPLPNGNFIVASHYPKETYGTPTDELYICVEDANGVCIQDLGMVRSVENKENLVELLVWGDVESEDYTDRFEVELLKDY